jgi:hypothetical protein
MRRQFLLFLVILAALGGLLHPMYRLALFLPVQAFCFTLSTIAAMLLFNVLMSLL